MNEATRTRVIQLSNYVKPPVVEDMTKDYVLNGPHNNYFQYIIDRYNGSPTNSALIDAYSDRVYGKGLSIVNSKTNASEYAKLLSILSAKETRKMVFDFILFGSCVGQVIYAKSKDRRIAKIKLLDRIMVAPGKRNNKGEVDTFFFCQDWRNTNKYKPEPYPSFGTSSKNVEIFEIKAYKPGKQYFADPGYLPGLQWAMLEEEIANFSVNHIKNGLSMGWVFNYNNGIPEEEEQIEIEKKVISKTTGSNNAGRIVINFSDSANTAPTIEAIPDNANHEQWQFWAGEARQQIITAHRVTTPMLVGVKDNTGLGNNANEMKEGSKLLHETSVRPKQEVLINALEEIVALNEISSPLVFIPLEEEVKKEQEQKEEVQLKAHTPVNVADYLIGLGEEEPEGYEAIDDSRVEKYTISEGQLNRIIELASVPSGDSRKRSDQDTSLFKIRYKYAGSLTPQREFCTKIMLANKVYRYEDLMAAENRVVNQGFGPNGTNKYSIFLYKGGVNCKHWWKRIIYLKKGNKKISVNQARKMILELDPKDRKDARWDENPKEVAQIAGPNNNHWKLN